MNVNSMLYWWPLLKGRGVPHPQTYIIPVPEEAEIWRVLDGGQFPLFLVQKIIEAVGHVGWPCFIRGDLASAKHQWLDSCFVPDTLTLLNHLYSLVEFTAMTMDLPPPAAFVVRPLLKLKSTFTAFNGLPISRERRYFVEDGAIVCHHPYWPEEVIRLPSIDNWRDALRDLNEETDLEVELLTEYAIKLAQYLEGGWSLDFACLDTGEWVFIDAALAAESWHPDHETQQ